MFVQANYRKPNEMKTVKLIIIGVLALFSFTQCNSQPTKKEIMKTDNSKKEIIVDVRSHEEWEYDGHADCSVNYPLDEFDSKITELKNYDKVTLVCRSGNRAGIAKAKLMSAGYNKEIENLGPWQNVTCSTK